MQTVLCCAHRGSLSAGMCHLVMGATYQPLELACLKALEHACGLRSNKLVRPHVQAVKGVRCDYCMPCSQCRCLLDSCVTKPKS